MLHRANFIDMFVRQIRSRLRIKGWKRRVAWIELRYLPDRAERVGDHVTVSEAIRAALKIADRLDRKTTPFGRDRPVAVEVHTQARLEVAISLSNELTQVSE